MTILLVTAIVISVISLCLIIAIGYDLRKSIDNARQVNIELIKKISVCDGCDMDDYGDYDDLGGDPFGKDWGRGLN